jgi:Xaa-Pro aminopeptidase
LSERLQRVRNALEREGLDALLVGSPVDDVFHTHSQNREWLTGFTGSSGYALVTGDRALIALDSRYWEQGEHECHERGFEVFRTEGRIKHWLPDLLGEAGLGASSRLGISRADMSLETYVALQEAVAEMSAAAQPELVPAPPILEELRARKDADEVELLQRAIDIGDAAFERVAAALTPGQTEAEVAAAIEAAVKGLGAESVSFNSIVAGGAWGAMPHASPREEPIEAGAAVVIDMGARYRGYCSDLTRTVVAGEPDERFRAVYEIVFEAQRTAIERVEAGMSGAQAHALAFDVIESRGYGKNFGHGLGHGVGLAVHEFPLLGPYSDDMLEDGMVFTIEPGIYIPGWGGVRIEDVVVLERGRARVLSHASKLNLTGA